MEANRPINGVNGISHGQGLKVIIIGAGIGGLAAAINLAKQGHEIIVSTSTILSTSQRLT